MKKIGKKPAGKGGFTLAELIGYAYSDGQYSVEWFPEDGWSDII